MEEVFDLLVIGGGITGAGIARDAALRGLSVCLVEKNQFGSGTSSKSSKLIHGGIRYLEQYQFGLVREACRERETLLQKAPKLVWPLAFVLPVYKESGRSKLKIKAGLWLYDLYSSPPAERKHRSLSAEEIASRFPGIKSDSLRGGFLFYDAQTDDLALTKAVINSATQNGCRAFEQTELVGFAKEKNQLEGVLVRKPGAKETSLLRAKCIVNATGPWVDSVCKLDQPEAKPGLRLTKGCHIVFAQSKFPAGAGLLLFAPQDGRVFFVLPWKGRTLVGTTDTDFSGSPDSVKTEAADIGYLLDAVSHYFPKLQLSSSDIVETFAGLRPLLRQEAGTASQASREHHIFDSSSGLVTIAGGKLTTYRRMAEELVNHAIKRLQRQGFSKTLKPCSTASAPLSP